ncbi:hypothetical protein I5907_20020 [Panacibacter sp. DH6]|uniref:Uncharacterized protein n=1 Tax=Panacibacter microcysteis TaxID=2793269 RepID=A0A931MDS5_9BACT|nr:hypothetical protein [Panacibacter microcysteis]MBG9378533.1 hypothetical protein [Panacibacter microcysteis]
MFERFQNYLIEQGYSLRTPLGKPSTVFDYSNRIQTICDRENVSINQLADNIAHFIQKYDAFGLEAEFGRRSHSAYINALRRFEEFINIK